MIPVYTVGEDEVCCSLARALIAQSEVQGIAKYSNIAGGFGAFVSDVERMNRVAANSMPVLMLADADQDPCVVNQVRNWMPRHPAPAFSMRLAVREAESWILADREGFSQFLEVSPDVLPPAPDTLDDPKQALLAIVRRSRKRILREEMLPARRSSAPVGLGYNIHLTDFISNHWSATRAMERSPSLARAIPRIADLLRQGGRIVDAANI